ncbi:hypothetical protein PMAYCL1PPCAC_12330, partial [Pristionchus mayeri]
LKRKESKNLKVLVQQAMNDGWTPPNVTLEEALRDMEEAGETGEPSFLSHLRPRGPIAMTKDVRSTIRKWRPSMEEDDGDMEESSERGYDRGLSDSDGEERHDRSIGGERTPTASTPSLEYRASGSGVKITPKTASRGNRRTDTPPARVNSGTPKTGFGSRRPLPSLKFENPPNAEEGVIETTKTAGRGAEASHSSAKKMRLKCEERATGEDSGIMESEPNGMQPLLHSMEPLREPSQFTGHEDNHERYVNEGYVDYTRRNGPL